jgi:hypothetical protein
MAERLRVYLAGPITGCTDEQRTWWREQVKQRLGREFDFEDPVEWCDDKEVQREIAKLEASHIVLANMWKESIGTTVGMIRATQQGKPVVLIDPNHINNPHLESLVLPQKAVRTIDEACKRLEQLAAELGPLRVHKKNGEDELFYPSKVTRSLALAAAEAGATDAAFEERISSRAIANLRRKGEQRANPQKKAYVTSDEIRGELFEQLENMGSNARTPTDLKDRAKRVLDAWRRKEHLKEGEEAIREADARAQSAKEEAAKWKSLYMDVREKGVPEADVPDEQQPVAAARFKSVDQVLDQFTKKWWGFVIIHPEAKSTARDIKPVLTARGREELYELLEELAEFARDRFDAAAGDEPPPSLEGRFGDRYAPTESAETKERYRKETREYEGRRYRGLPHLKMKAESGQRIRLYFEELPSGQYLIGWIGHRPTYSHDG